MYYYLVFKFSLRKQNKKKNKKILIITMSQSFKELEHSRIALSLKSIGYTKGNVLAYCYFGGPNIKREHILEAKESLLYVHDKYITNIKSKKYIQNEDDRIQREIDLINDFFVENGYDEFRLIGTPLPLYLHHLIHVINGSKTQIGRVFFDRIADEAKSKKMSYKELDVKIKVLFGENVE